MNLELLIGDFYEIDTRGGARDFQSRRPTPPRAYPCPRVRGLPAEQGNRKKFYCFSINFGRKTGFLTKNLLWTIAYVAANVIYSGFERNEMMKYVEERAFDGSGRQ